MLVHVTGDDVTWTMSTGDEPLYASLDASELEQCMTAIVTQGREALPLGGPDEAVACRDGAGRRPR